MEYRDEKRRLYQLAVEQGLDSSYNFLQCTGAPPQFVERWMKRFFSKPDAMEFPKIPKLVNHFALGADPEFAFLDVNGHYIHAETQGMTTILPFGCDMAGRQVELRAHSSRFALEVVASMVDALRWIPQIYPSTTPLNWIAAPQVGNDGCGGHVHFGRKRPERQKEIDALDTAFQLLIAAGVFDLKACTNRRNVTKYGRYGDFRLQSHGYEYRSYPTEMYSPWGMYFVIVVSKLLLQYGVHLQIVPKREIHQLVNLLRYFQHDDDDAAIALRAWHKHGFPVAHEKDFKSAWGVSNVQELRPPSLKTLYFPLSLPPEERTCNELFAALTEGIRLAGRGPKPNWTPYQLGRDFSSVSVAPHVFEIPNIAQGLVSKFCKVHVGFSQAGTTVQLIGATNWLNQDEIRKAFEGLECRTQFVPEQIAKELVLTVNVPKSVTDDREKVRLFRSILCNTTLFPICKGEDINKVDWSMWDTPVDFASRKSKISFRGQVLAVVKGQNAPKPKSLQQHVREEW